MNAVYAILTFCLVLILSPTAFSQSASSLPLNSEGWGTITDGGAVKLSSDNEGLSFNFPVSAGKHGTDRTMNALLTSEVPALASAASLSATFKIIVSGSPVFEYVFESTNTCIKPAHVRLWFARRGWRGNDEFYRWWANPIAYQLASGGTGLAVPLTADQWVSVFGKTGNHDAVALEGFRAALKETGQVGLVFGGGCFFGHGVNVSGGTARFVLSDYSVL
jgi:hypothetical protein